MTCDRILIAALLAAAMAAAPVRSPSAGAASEPQASAPIARVGDRAVDEADIRAAAAALADDPLRRKDPARWRKMLVDRCIDRELLAGEAGRKGYGEDPEVKSRVRDREYQLLFREIYSRVLVPGIEPTPHQIDSLQATGLYRAMDLDYILLGLSEAARGKEIVEQLRHGASFDSTARLLSLHPSRTAGGHFGWMLARDMDPHIYSDLKNAKPTDIFGPYVGTLGGHIFRVRSFQNLSPDSIYRLVKDERTKFFLRDYQAELLRKYHFALDTTQVNTVLFVAATEPVARVLASLGPDGTRPREEGQHALGVIARVDGDSITFRDLAQADRRTWEGDEKLHLRDGNQLTERCHELLVPVLVIRDAQRLGIDRDPPVARGLRLIREEEETRAMVAHEAGGPSDSAAIRAYYEAHAARYRRPAGVRARAFCFLFDSTAQARSALQSWLIPGVSDSVIEAHGFKPQPRATATTVWPERYGEITMLDSDSDPVADSVRGVPIGQLSPAISSIQGIVVVEPLARDASRALAFDEAAPMVRRDARIDRESRWVTTTLSRLRSGTRIEVATARLAKLKLDVGGSKKGTP